LPSHFEAQIDLPTGAEYELRLVLSDGKKFGRVASVAFFASLAARAVAETAKAAKSKQPRQLGDAKVRLNRKP
jgi:hypothetical protein